MDALVLAAGYSKRLEPLTLTCAKPLLPVGGRPMVEYLLEKLRAIPDLRRLLLVSNAKFYGDFVAWGRPHGVVIVNDGTRTNEERLGAVRDIELVIQTQQVTDDLLVVAGDNLFDAPLTGLVEEARAHAPRVTIGVVDLQDRELIRRRYGVVQLDAPGHVTEFFEKPDDPATTLVSTGLYYFPGEQLKTINAYIARGGKTDNIGDLIHALVHAPGVHAARLPGRWFDIGDLASYEQANRTFRR
ncbi:MAG: nucleotidyltransferase family protein [Candidatus Omnitrophica bacterium]|nr:nucleotidyltransferase family protein [Candidatus Omnitrophota bacterium]